MWSSTYRPYRGLSLGHIYFQSQVYFEESKRPSLSKILFQLFKKFQVDSYLIVWYELVLKMLSLLIRYIRSAS